jgi:DNA-binding CsgD family transcriptional regulator
MYRRSASHDHVDLGRWHLAIMFAEFAGVSGLIASMGAETAVGRLMPAVDQLVALVRAHGGSVQCIVDGSAMFVFGLDSADGRQAARALSVGRAFLTAAAQQDVLPARVGIECGEVVVSRSWEPAGVAVWGDTVTTARRVCGAADPGTMLLGPRASGLGSAHCCPRSGQEGRARRRGPGETGPQWPSPGALTQAETVVARLVAEGLSNPQIASRLCISRHTAETHMKHIFAKLGVSSRAELAARVASQLVHGVA